MQVYVCLLAWKVQITWYNMLETIDWGTITQAGAGAISLYLATQIRAVVKNHEVRIQSLEEKRLKAKSRRRVTKK